MLLKLLSAGKAVPQHAVRREGEEGRSWCCWSSCCCVATSVEVVTVVAAMLLLLLHSIRGSPLLCVLAGVTNVEDDNDTQRMLQMECLLRYKEAVYIGEMYVSNTYNISCTQDG